MITNKHDYQSDFPTIKLVYHPNQSIVRTALELTVVTTENIVTILLLKQMHRNQWDYLGPSENI